MVHVFERPSGLFQSWRFLQTWVSSGFFVDASVVFKGLRSMPPTQVGGCRAARMDQIWTSQANVRVRRLFSPRELVCCPCGTLQGCRLQAAGCKGAGCKAAGSSLRTARLQAAGCARQGYRQHVARLQVARLQGKRAVPGCWLLPESLIVLLARLPS